MTGHLVVLPDQGDGKTRFEMDSDGLRMLEKLVAQSQPKATDSPKHFIKAKSRVEGALLVARVQHGWPIGRYA